MSHTHIHRNYHARVVSLTLVLALAFSLLLSARVGIATAQTAGPRWTYTGNLNAARQGHTATLLPGGKVLIVGGYGAAGLLNTAELYDPFTGTWSLTGNLNVARADHTATLLPNGKVLIAGGGYTEDFDELKSAELYDPATGTWTSTGNLNIGRDSHTATLLPNGKVLVAGGYNGDDFINFEARAELYDPTTGTWSITGSLHQRRANHSSTLLPDGRVLVAGGTNQIFSPPASPTESLRSSELYDPNTGTWSVTGNLNVARDYHTATILRNGNVLVVGGGQYQCSGIGGINFSCSHSAVNSVELHNPGTGEWSSTASLNTPRNSHTATLLPDGRVLIAGGSLSFWIASEIAEIYDPATGNCSRTASLNVPRYAHTATLLSSGNVLVAGGIDEYNGLSSAELYGPLGLVNPNPIDDPQFFVRQHYRDFLGREPDPDGLNFWTGEIFQCGSDPQCIEVRRINDSASFFLSIEFQETGYLVYRFYKAAYGNLPNAPVPITLAEFLPDTQEIGRGVIVRQPGWEQALENNKQAFTADFVRRQRFVSAFPTSLSPDSFVDALFVNAGVTPSSNERTSTIAEFGSATNTADVSARARVLRQIADNSTFSKQEFNRAFVLMQYFGYFRRNPNDAPDSDFSGYNFWLQKLDQFQGDFVQAEMVKAFLSSTEYRQRFEQ
jgi:hypothetical protein